MPLDHLTLAPVATPPLCAIRLGNPMQFSCAIKPFSYFSIAYAGNIQRNRKESVKFPDSIPLFLRRRILLFLGLA